MEQQSGAFSSLASESGTSSATALSTITASGGVVVGAHPRGPAGLHVAAYDGGLVRPASAAKRRMPLEAFAPAGQDA